jgi:hypothetical protein
MVYTYRKDNNYIEVPNEKRGCPNEKYPGKEGENEDYTDVPVRALIINVTVNGVKKDMISLSTGHLHPNRMIGDNFDNLKKVCIPVWISAFDPILKNQKWNEWYSSAYTKDGIRILAIAQNDWHASIALKNHPRLKDAWSKCTTQECSYCKENPFNCWWLALTFMMSNDSGASYQKPFNYILAESKLSKIDDTESSLSSFVTNRFAAGYYQTSNILKGVMTNDKNYYFITRFKEKPLSATTTTTARFVMCRALESDDISIPMSWKGFSRGSNNFVGNLRESEGEAPIEFNRFGEIRHISYNVYLRKYIIFGYGNTKFTGGKQWVAYMCSKNDNILEWDTNSFTLVMPTTYDVNNVNYDVRYPTLIDHDYDKHVIELHNQGIISSNELNERRNFDITGRYPYLYTTLRKGEGNNVLYVVRTKIEIK